MFEKNEFQHRLIGYSNTWSNWSDKPSNTYNNLADGEYIFELRTKNGDLINPEVKILSFEISPPWYLSNFMLINYFLLSALFWYLTNMYTRRYYNWKENRLQKINRKKIQLKEIERKQTISNLENKQLQQDIENKNRELAASTMSMIKKNQFLNKIKKDLKKTGDSQHIFRVIKTIDNNLNNEDDWRFFEEAFNNADREFLKKIKRIHNKLTKNDLKLCAYLRLNLSSKDIAPLLNISLRSVEIKRYRLRKKMKLSHNEGLTEYILSI
jgi:DNA-binding CsgD family transcriptional regulator